MRIDTLSQTMNLGNVRPGGRYIVVDEASGMVVSALLERLGGLFPIHALLTSAPSKL
jgi:tRNA (adenine-N(1)-)-methyltransferase non-catalytic subunit